MLKQLLIAIDQVLNTLLGGMADETLSARAHRMHVAGKRSWPRNAINSMFFLQDDHCYDSYISETDRKHLPAQYRQE